MNKVIGLDHQTNGDQKETVYLSKIQTISTISDLAKNLSIKGDEKSTSTIVNLPSSSFTNHNRSSSDQSKSSFLNQFNNQNDVVDVMPKAMVGFFFEFLIVDFEHF